MVRTISDEHVDFIGRVAKAVENHNANAKKTERANDLPEGYLGRISASDLYAVWCEQDGENRFPISEYGLGADLWSFDMRVPRAAMVSDCNTRRNFQPLYRNYAKGADPEVVFTLREEIRILRAQLAEFKIPVES